LSKVQIKEVSPKTKTIQL